jgi:nitrogenase molybdenum-iron protein alpha chain
VLPTVKLDADTKNIEELTVARDEERYHARKSEEEMAKLGASDLEFMDYKGMMQETDEGVLILDDISHHETERLLEIYKPAIFCAGIKEKYAVQKMGIPCKQLHSYDYGGPYAGFEGAINFYREIDRMVNMKVWSFLQAPWQQPTIPPEITDAAAD